MKKPPPFFLGGGGGGGIFWNQTCCHYYISPYFTHVIADHCERLQEVLKTERILRENEDDLPTFLNLTFEEVCIHGTTF